MIKAYAKSDIGKAREMNQDAYYISDSTSEVKLYLLADGMGGYKGGEIASNLAIKCTKSYIENNFKETPKDKESLIQLVASSMEYANMVVYERAKENKELENQIVTDIGNYKDLIEKCLRMSAELTKEILNLKCQLKEYDY